MTKPRYLILLIELLFTSVCLSQQSPEYLFGKDDPGLRQKYLTETTIKEKLAMSNADKQYSADYKKIYKEEYGAIEQFWSDTRAITTPEVNNYLQAVVQKIISSNPDLKSTIDVRVVFSRDWWPNASCMADGSIAINAGLYIFLRNEAELAFVISHELAHYYLHHHEKEVRSYVEKINGKEYQKKLRQISRQGYSVNQQLNDLLKTMVFDSRRHGRGNESEADEYALRFMKNTGYDCNAIKTCLQTLDGIDDTTYFKSPPEIQKELDFPNYPFKQNWIAKQSSIFSQIKEDDSPQSKQERDSLKTHPDCQKRILLFEAHWKDDGEKRTSFLVSEEKFKELKTQLFYQIMEECYHEDELSRNLYYALTLLKNDPVNQFAVYSVVRCFNRLWYLQKNHKLQQAIEKEDQSFPAQYNILVRMLDRLRLDEIVSLNSAFAARHAEQMKTFPGFAAELDMLHKINN
jgi:predicted metal-dependent hydrolase